MKFTKFNFFKDRVILNCLAKDISNAEQVVNAADGHVAIGLLSTSFPTVEENVTNVKSYQKKMPLISVGLGGGSPKQWKMAAEIAAQTDPGHVNQVFPASGYTLGLLSGNGCEKTIVNALISPTGTPGKVKISTGVYSQESEGIVDILPALWMMKDVGLQSVKFFHMKGNKYIEDLKAVVKACEVVGIDMIEPTGGITVQNLPEIVDVCVHSKVRYIMPHLYSSIIDKESGLTDSHKVSEILSIFTRCA